MTIREKSGLRTFETATAYRSLVRLADAVFFSTTRPRGLDNTFTILR